MLERLLIQNIALIDRAEMEFSGGLNVLSGETGAGKSVILDSIDFVLGGKADRSMIRYGQTECAVRAEFFIGGNKQVKEALAEMDLDGEEDLLIVSRKYSLEGKGSIKLNGCSVTAAMLRKVTSLLVDVHGQSEHFYLLKESNQLALLDKIAGKEVTAHKEAVSDLLSRRNTLLKELSALGGDEGERSHRLDVLRFQIEEIASAELQEGEEETLSALREKIAHAEKILNGLNTAQQCLSTDGSGLDAVRSALRALSALSRFDSAYAELADRLETIAADLTDVSDTVECLGEEADFDEREAERVENRLDEIKRLKKKYGGSIAEIFSFYESAKAEYELLSDSGARFEQLTKALANADKNLYEACLSLTNARKNAAKTFTDRVIAELKTLNISSARFEVQFDGYSEQDVSRANKNGLDGVRFLFSANAGEPLKELGKIISGGEMSRFMLAVKAQLSALNEIGTYLFDEIDAGIGGATARVVAEKFCKISLHTQIIAVSHLARIAAAADKQFLIEKTQSAEKTATHIYALSENERLKEIARLIGGDTQSGLALQHAEELLKEGKIYKNSLSQI